MESDNATIYENGDLFVHDHDQVFQFQEFCINYQRVSGKERIGDPRDDDLFKVCSFLFQNRLWSKSPFGCVIRFSKTTWPWQVRSDG